MNDTDELLRIVDHLIKRGATALEVTCGSASVKANLVPGGGTGLIEDVAEDEDDVRAQFEKSLYYSAGKDNS